VIRKRVGVGLLTLAAISLCNSTSATTRELIELRRTPLTPRSSVIQELSGGVLFDPYDELLFRPFNLMNVNIERYGNLSPWPGQAGEQSRYVDVLIGNNGNTNVRNGADTLQGTYIAQPGDSFVWGLTAAYVGDQVVNADLTSGSNFADGEELFGTDARFAASYRVSNRILLGGGVSVFSGNDKIDDASFLLGVGGSYSRQELQQSGFEADFGMRLFSGERSSWSGSLLLGSGSTDLDDFAETLDATGAVTSRFVINQFEVSDQYVELSAGHNRRFLESDGEMAFTFGVRQSQNELDNSDLSFTDTVGVITPTLTLLDQDAVSGTKIYASATTLFTRNWTQIFGRATLSHESVDGSTQVDSLGLIVNEAIDDTNTKLTLVMGLRQPLWNEKFRLVASARADWIDQQTETAFDASTSVTELRRTTTNYAIGVETVLNNVVFDMAWLFGSDATSAATTLANRQTIDLDRLVISASFGW